jgi:hypothetical protein
MKRGIATVICIAGAALLGTIAVAVTANGQSGPRAITIHASSQLEHAHLVDNPPSGNSAGDVLIFTEKLLNSNGDVIGSDAASCTFLFDQRSLCTGTYVLPHGQLMVQLIQPGLSGTLTYSQAIVGGTGRYARATGTVTVHQKASGDRFTFHIHLRR